MKNNIYLPIEITNRELDYKILLAAELYDNQKRIFIGENKAINQALKFTQYGSFVGKSFITPYLLNDLTVINYLKKKSIDIVYIDEEGAVYAGDEENWKSILQSKFSPDILDEDDILTTWGEFQEEVYSQMKHKCQIIVSGTPRFTLLQKYNSIIKKPLNAPNKYILINTNFGFSLSSHGATYYLNSEYRFMKTRKEDLDYKFGRWTNSNIVCSHFIEMIHNLSSRIKKHQIVIRPHPSEDKDFYIKAFSNHDNILVDDSLSAINWMKYADIIIHNGSTSAIEGFFLNKPIINYVPFADTDYMIKLPNMIGKNISNINYLLITINDYFECKNWDLVVNNNFTKMIVNSSPNIDSFLTIVSSVNKQLLKQKKVKLNIEVFKFFYNFVDLKRKLKNIIRRFFFREKYKSHLSMQKKFTGYKKKEITSKIDQAFKLNNKKYNNIHFINENLFIID